MVITRLMHGLGNQLFQIACGWALARRTKRRCAFDVSWYRRNRFRQLYLKDLAVKADRLPWRVRATLPHRRGRWETFGRVAPRWALPHPPVHVIQQYETQPNDLINLAAERSIYLDGYWQSEGFFYDCADQIRAMFTYPASPKIPRTQPGAYVAVHVRRGDYLEAVRNTRIGVLADAYYQRAIESLSKELGAIVAVVFTDEPRLVQPTLQLGVPTIFPDQSHGSSLDSLRLMASCDHFVLANSSFSWWAAWLGEHREKKVIVPRPWPRGQPFSAVQRIPKDWRSLDAVWLDEKACARLRAARAV